MQTAEPLSVPNADYIAQRTGHSWRARGRPAIVRAAIARPLRLGIGLAIGLGIGIVPSYGAIAMG